MGTIEKPELRKRQQNRDGRKSESFNSEIRGGIISGVKDSARDAILRDRPYLNFAFKNPYNLSLFLGGLSAAGLTLNPVLAVIVLGLEAVWLLNAPDSKRLRHILWDPRFEKVKHAIEARERDEKTASLSVEERDRVEQLVDHQREIERLAAGNPSFTGELLRGELVKTDRLVSAFVDMSLTCARYADYLVKVDLASLERDRQRWETKLRSGKPDDPQTEIAKKNFAIILKRLDKMREIREYLAVARGQLDLIENSFRLIADQIVTMQSPHELFGQLDELLDGVESIKQTAADTEKLLGTIGA